jgi:hypothetical protein
MQFKYCINNNLGSLKTFESIFYRKRDFNPIILLEKRAIT